ncbi:hypothetical protein [Sphingobacterium bovistauri]|uniref:Fimbrillin-A associated anchor protein Mfa1 and Mfa2 n=1 Tax=Sphingobacterium bovistauri TaxID=2781959 RepID=A0ABS7Z9C2_9SPHI|nr:hypothetical protein [Sphingobacterium bovistauri]MCA5006182.1 hypothetical protein [Sphingobacterium bovistauri]
MSKIKISNKLITIYLFIFILTVSCKKTNDEVYKNGEALVSVNIKGFNFDSEIELNANTTNPGQIKNITPVHIQHANQDYQIESQLIHTQSNDVKNSLETLRKSSSSILKEFGNGIHYTLLVYDSRKDLIAQKNFIYGQETIESSLKLSSNIRYTFIVVSAKSTTTVPTIEDVNNLDNAKIVNINADLLYWKEERVLNVGQNYLSAILKPQFSEITTILEMDPNMTGNITRIVNPTFNLPTQNVSLKLSNKALTYHKSASQYKAVIFPNIRTNNIRSIKSNTTTIIHNSDLNTFSLKFDSLRVDGETKSDITISGLNIAPGHRYNLILTLKTCTEAVNGLNGMNWSYDEDKKGNNSGIYLPRDQRNGWFDDGFRRNGEVISFTFNEAGADYGFVYDITELDNAFNLEVNGKPIFGTDILRNEIQFQNNATLTTQNIEFEDGSQYQSDDVPSIWNLKGTSDKPIVKVVISRFGEVLMFGSKVSGGTLYPLKLKNNAKFNTVTWKGGNQTNQIKASTRIEGKTVMKSMGSGRRKIACSK